MPARDSSALARTLAPLTSKGSSSGSSGDTGALEATGKGRARSLSNGASSGRAIVKIVKGEGILALSAASKPYCLLEVNGTAAKSASPHLPGSSTSRGAAGNPVFDYSADFDLTSEECEVHVSLYDRSGAPGDDEAGYIAGAMLQLTLSRKAAAYERTVSLVDRKGVPVDGLIHLHLRYEPHKRRRMTPDDFEIFEIIGEGAFGTVYRVRKRDTDRIYAMKVLSKSNIAKSQTASHVLAERKVLQRAHSLNSAFLVSLKFSFQTDTHLYLVMDYKPGGELFTHLAANGGRFREEHFVRFYLAEILLALAHLHERKIVYRDLKPENILLDALGHIALCDFGLSKPLDAGGKTRTFCGTGDYLAPETILDEGSSYSADWWAYGVLAYEIFNGYTPFYSEDKDEKYRMILNKPVKVTGALSKSETAGDLIKKLLCRDPASRLGANGAAEIKAHPFFASIDWDALASKRISPPFKPPEAVTTPSLVASEAGSISESSGSAGKIPVSRRSSCESRPARPALFHSKSSMDLAGLNAQNTWRDFTYTAPRWSETGSCHSMDSDVVSLASFGSADSGRKGRRSWSRRSSRGLGLDGIRNMLKMTSTPQPSAA